MQAQSLYLILWAHTPDDLAAEVNRYLCEGWEPAGGPVVDGNYWRQAVWRKEKPRQR